MQFIKKTQNTQFLFGVLFITLLSLVCSFFFDWYNIIFVSFIINLIFKQKPFRAFISGFIAIFLLWFGLSMYLNIINQHIIEKVVSNMLIGVYIPYGLNFLTGMTGGLVGGLGALLGSHFGAILKSKKYPKETFNTEPAIVDNKDKEDIKPHSTLTSPINKKISQQQSMPPNPISIKTRQTIASEVITKKTIRIIENQDRDLDFKQFNDNVIELSTTTAKRTIQKLSEQLKNNKELEIFKKKNKEVREITNSKPLDIPSSYESKIPLDILNSKSKEK